AGITLFKRKAGFERTKALLDGVGLRMYAHDRAISSARKAHALDALETVPPTAIATVKKAGFVVNQVPAVTENDFIFNSNPKKTSHRELLSPKLREAFEHAIDRQQIAHVVWLDTAKPGASIIPPATGAWH